ncbi:MAG: aminopeptidase [Phycisphaerales bacterium]|nr:aminopeptidase [Phycisphaerales bacterium]
MHDQRLERLARVLVDYSMAVKRGDVVGIRMSPLAEPLVLALYRSVLGAGGHPVVRMAPEECAESLAKSGTARQLAYLFPPDLVEIDELDCYVTAWGSRNSRSMSNVDPDAQAAISKARRPLFDAILKRIGQSGPRKLRWVGTQFPCHSAAQDAEMSLSEYADFVFGAGHLDRRDPVGEWKRMGIAQQRVADHLNKARELRYVTEQGTDIRFGIHGRNWINCDGKNNFPDGEVFTGPIESATEGEVRFNFPAVFQGREITDVRLKFRGGKVVDADAAKGRDFLYKMMDQDAGGRILGEVAMGTNYSIQKFTRNTLFDEKIGGTVHMALGASLPRSGGKNKSALHWDMVLDLRRGGRIEADGKVISKNGRFTRAGFPRPR